MGCTFPSLYGLCATRTDSQGEFDRRIHVPLAENGRRQSATPSRESCLPSTMRSLYRACGARRGGQAPQAGTVASHKAIANLRTGRAEKHGIIGALEVACPGAKNQS